MSISKDCRDNLIYYAKIMEKSGKEVDLSNLQIHKVVEKFEADYDVGYHLHLRIYIIIFTMFNYLNELCLVYNK